MQRLDKFLVSQGYGSRTEVKAMAKKGRIFVNGKKTMKTETKIDETRDLVEFDDDIVVYKQYTYIMLNKKAGFVTANEDHCDPTVFDLLDDKYKKMNMFAVGRLDKDTEGLLLITNDGDMNHALMSPKKHVDKVYYVEVSGTIKDEHIKVFADGIVFKDGTKLKPAKLEIIDENKAYVTISEGKHHQVKNMFRVIDITVTYLKRVKLAGLELDTELEIGKYRELYDHEEQYLKEITGILC